MRKHPASGKKGAANLPRFFFCPKSKTNVVVFRFSSSSCHSRLEAGFAAKRSPATLSF
jgi:hypothetical protein